MYPKINYIGNKEKIVDWIMSLLPQGVTSLFDIFSGGSSVGYRAKELGLRVVSNDILTVNYHIARALIENPGETLTQDDIDTIFTGTPVDGFMYENFADRLYFADECRQLDLYRHNINLIDNPYKQSLALILMRRAMIRKMPYSRFNIKWDKIVQLRDEEFSYAHYGRRRAYHNLPFRHHFEDNLAAYNAAVFDNGRRNQALNLDATDAARAVEADIVYIDPPYAGTLNDYFAFYGPLDSYIESRLVKPFANNFTDKATIADSLDGLFARLGHFRYWMMSYNSRSFPTKDTIIELMSRHHRRIQVFEMPYAYRLTGKEKKKKDIEYLFIASNQDE